MTKNEFDYRKLHYIHCAGYGVIKKRKVPCNFVLVRGEGVGWGASSAQSAIEIPEHLFNLGVGTLVHIIPIWDATFACF